VPELLGLVGLDESVAPRVMPPDAPVGEVRGVLVGPGTGDNMAAALGIALQPGDVMVSIGTSGTVFAVSETPTADATGAVAGFADATGRYLPLVCTLNAARVTDTIVRLLGVDHSRFDQLAMGSPPGAGGLVLVPYFDGERTPNRPAASGVLAGIRTDTTPATLARATVEGVVCGLLEGLDALGSAGVAIGGGRLVLVGGGSKSAAYRQVLADLSQRPVTVPSGGEFVVAGACAQAASLVAGRPAPDVASQWGLDAGAVVEPDSRVDAPGIRRAYWEARVRTFGH
jgi:xylulokinase